MLKSFIRKSEWFVPAALFALAAVFHSVSHAETTDGLEDSEEAPSASTRLIDQLALNIGKQYPGAKISVNSQVHWTRGSLSENFQSVALLGETSRGEMMFTVTGADGRRGGEGWAGFSAWVPARVAVKRVHPGDRLTSEMFSQQTVNVVSGQAHELRGVILEPEAELAGLEARQTVLEGQLLLSTSVQKIPDVRRGDSVSVHLLSNGLSLVTQGVAEEPAYTGGQIRVSASKTKRELVGRLSPSGIVEVKL